MKKHGFDVLPIDFHGNKQRPFIHVVELDLRKRSTWEFLEYLVDTRVPFFFHAAPPCGTSSRARDRPMSDTHHGPPKLRSEEYPLGFPWLTGYWKAKVQSANDIYIKLVAFIFLLNLLGIFWSVENPGQSYMWDIEDFAILKRTYFFVLFHACIHGSRRKKLTAFLTNLERLTALAGFCRDDHEHLPWGYTVEDGTIVFDTSKEAAYPKLLCERFATILATEANCLHLALNPGVDDSQVNIDARVATGKQPRGRKLPPLITEFATTRTIRSADLDEPILDEKQHLVHQYHGVPSGSKLLRTAKGKRGEPGNDDSLTLRVFGIYCGMLDFFEIAKAVQHPFDTFRALPDDMLEVVVNIMQDTPLDVMRKRLQLLQPWRNTSISLSNENDAIFSSMDGGCAAVLNGKHLALLERLAKDIDWPDLDIHASIREGFQLVGMQQPSGIFESDIKPRTLSRNELLQQAKFIKPALWKKIETGRREQYDEELWNITLDEVREKRWLDGPYSFEELEVMFDGVWLPVRRFAVWQRSKWRPIDDFSECGVNASFAYVEKIQLRALDEILWIANCFVKLCVTEKRFDFCLQSGKRLCGEVNKVWQLFPADDVQLVAKTVDLKSAYKQLAIAPDNRRLSVISLRNPESGKTCGFVSRTLPFGSVASVLHFNRVSRLLHKLGLQANIPWANYYDDFPIVDFRVLSEHTTAAVRAMMSLLGFECSLEKELPFDTSTEMLGVVLDLSECSSGRIKVANKESRVNDLANALTKMLNDGFAKPRELPSVFGRALFVESQLMGRAGRLALSELRVLERSGAGHVKISDVQKKALNVLLERYSVGRPRTINVDDSSLPAIIFTDGACETVDGVLTATIGGILYLPGSQDPPIVFGSHVNHDALRHWTDCGKQHPVALTEMYAICTARYIWKEFLDGKKCIFFVDNQGVLDAFIKGYSNEQTIKELLLNFETHDLAWPCFPWFARVPSSSNLSDLPSRGLWNELKKLLPSFTKCVGRCPLSRCELKNFES